MCMQDKNQRDRLEDGNRMSIKREKARGDTKYWTKKKTGEMERNLTQDGM